MGTITVGPTKGHGRWHRLVCWLRGHHWEEMGTTVRASVDGDEWRSYTLDFPAYACARCQASGRITIPTGEYRLIDSVYLVPSDPP